MNITTCELDFYIILSDMWSKNKNLKRWIGKERKGKIKIVEFHQNLIKVYVEKKQTIGMKEDRLVWNWKVLGVCTGKTEDKAKNLLAIRI